MPLPERPLDIGQRVIGDCCRPRMPAIPTRDRADREPPPFPRGGGPAQAGACPAEASCPAEGGRRKRMGASPALRPGAFCAEGEEGGNSSIFDNFCTHLKTFFEKAFLPPGSGDGAPAARSLRSPAPPRGLDRRIDDFKERGRGRAWAPWRAEHKPICVIRRGGPGRRRKRIILQGGKVAQARRRLKDRAPLDRPCAHRWRS